MFAAVHESGYVKVFRCRPHTNGIRGASCKERAYNLPLLIIPRKPPATRGRLLVRRARRSRQSAFSPADLRRCWAMSRCPNEAGHGALAPHFRLLELGGGNRPVESGAQLLGGLQGKLDPGPGAGFEGGVDEV